jgi:hypothetical protein
MNLRARFHTVRDLVRHFAVKERALLLPMLVVLVLGTLLLGASAGVGHVAPFVYSLF